MCEAIEGIRADARAEGIEKGRAEGIVEGRAEGIVEGRAEGRAEGILSVASNLIKMGLSTESITQATGLSPKEIEKIRLYGIGSMTTSK